MLGALNTNKIQSFGKTGISSYPFTAEKLSYSFDSLEPSIDATTMELHYSKHYHGYIQNLNNAIKNSQYIGKDITYIIQHIDKDEYIIRNNGGGFLNHSFFWKCLTPREKLPSREFTKQINASFGSMNHFKAAFADAALNIFGSGWAWLIKDQNNKLSIATTSNQDNPQMKFMQQRGAPLLAIDVWEHAYYLRYNNRRIDYINSLWPIVNWDFVSSNFSTIRK